MIKYPNGTVYFSHKEMNVLEEMLKNYSSSKEKSEPVESIKQLHRYKVGDVLINKINGKRSSITGIMGSKYVLDKGFIHPCDDGFHYKDLIDSSDIIKLEPWSKAKKKAEDIEDRSTTPMYNVGDFLVDTITGNMSLIIKKEKDSYHFLDYHIMPTSPGKNCSFFSTIVTFKSVDNNLYIRRALDKEVKTFLKDVPKLPYKPNDVVWDKEEKKAYIIKECLVQYVDDSNKKEVDIYYRMQLKEWFCNIKLVRSSEMFGRFEKYNPLGKKIFPDLFEYKINNSSNYKLTKKGLILKKEILGLLDEFLYKMKSLKHVNSLNELKEFIEKWAIKYDYYEQPDGHNFIGLPQKYLDIIEELYEGG